MIDIFLAQVVIKATLFFTVMNLILEAINYYYDDETRQQ